MFLHITSLPRKITLLKTKQNKIKHRSFDLCWELLTTTWAPGSKNIQTENILDTETNGEHYVDNTGVMTKGEADPVPSDTSQPLSRSVRLWLRLSTNHTSQGDPSLGSILRILLGRKTWYRQVVCLFVLFVCLFLWQDVLRTFGPGLAPICVLSGSVNGVSGHFRYFPFMRLKLSVSLSW